MSRITKDIANEVAKKLTQNKTDEIENLENELRLKVHDIVKKRIPDSIIKLFKIHPNYFIKKSYFQFVGNGMNHKGFYINNELPFIQNNVVEPSKLEADTILKLDNEITNLKTKRNTLRSEIRELLYSLRTYSKVISEFPEAEPFLPKTITNKLIVNISDIRNQLK